MESTPDVLEIESTWTTSTKKPPTHWHPRQQEHFEVLEGELTVELDGAGQVLVVGDTIDVPPRTGHCMWNDSAATTRATWQITPALRTEEMFRFIDRETSLLGRIRMLVMFRHEFRLGRGASGTSG